MRLAQRAYLSQGETSPVSPLAIATALTLSLILVMALVPGFPSGRYAQDFTALLDGAYRIDQGQLPHRDFMVPFGGLILFQSWVAYKLQVFGPAFGLLQLSSWALLLPSTLSLASRQPRQGSGLVLIALIGILLLVPYVIEWEPIADVNYNAVYNRTASATLLLLFVWIFSPKRHPRSNVALVAWLLLLGFGWKISHAVVMVGILGLAALLSPAVRPIAWRAAALASATLLVLDLATGGIVRAYLGDIAEMAALNRGGSLYFVSALAVRNLPALAGVLVVAGWILGRRHSAARGGLVRMLSHPWLVARANRDVVWLLAVFAAVLATESQGTGNLGLFPVLALLFAPSTRLGIRRSGQGRSAAAPRILLAATLAMAAYPFAESVLRRASTLAVHEIASMRRDPSLDGPLGRVLVSRRVAETANRYLALWNGPEAAETSTLESWTSFAGGANATEPAMGIAWAHEVSRMAELARRRRLVTPDMRVMTIGYVEPFSRLLGARPTPGIRLWHDPWRTIGTLNLETARSYLAKADAVFVQRCPLQRQLIDMVDQSFRPAIDADFIEVAATSCYELWRRR